MNLEEFKDWYIETSFELRDLEIQRNLEIGKYLTEHPEVFEAVRLITKRKKTFLNQCIAVYQKWSELEKHYTKDKSWSDFVKMVNLNDKKASKKSIKQVILERIEMHKAQVLRTNDMLEQAKLDEDMEILEGGEE